MKEQGILTRAEMQLMRILWSLPAMKGTINEILAYYAGRKPAYTTVATVMRTLLCKGYAASEKLKGTKTLRFYPLVTREEYAVRVLNAVKDELFDGSFSALVSFCIREKWVSESDLKGMFVQTGCKSACGTGV